MAQGLQGELGADVSFSASGSVWAALQAETVIERRESWNSALGRVGPLARGVHQAQIQASTRKDGNEGMAARGYQVADLLLTQVSRAFNLLRKPVDRPSLDDADVYHSSYARIPHQVRKHFAGQHVLTVHDLTPLVLDDSLSGSGQIAITRRIVDSVQSNDWVIAVSESTRNDLCERRPIDPERVFVIPNAASEELFHSVSDTERIHSVRKKYNVPEGRYFLSLHSMAPHKNVSHLVRCFHRFIRQEKKTDLALVLAGGLGRSANEIRQALSLGKENLEHVHFTGYVEDQDLASLYSGAEAFAFPSLYEGFGLPALEAMQCGCPVITSNTSSLPEIVGDAGLLVDPRNPEELCQAMSKIEQSSSLASDLAEAGQEKARRFSWKRTVRETIDMYRYVDRLPST
jgi:glycosyltransferase involved in cell wall biosynthesis